ncbi:hypothetical protein FB451DRAFT_1247409 [Mycena latifolia]|nr:hypothetical protein FB451DRAFT_1247409 [Mycena latifolia]
MTAHIVLPPLKNWAEDHLSAIIKAETQAVVDEAVETFLAKDATFTVNGKRVSRDEYKNQLRGPLEQSATVKFSDAVEVPADKSHPSQAGSIGLFYTAVIVEGIHVHGAPVLDNVTSSVNLVIKEDKSLTPPHVGHGGLFDGRRVFEVNQIIASKTSNNFQS